MIIETLSTGDELGSGALIDTNSAWLAQKLRESGLKVSRHQCVGDNMEMLISIFQEIGQRADIALVTGGLGPTTDDLTSDAAAKAGNVGKVLDEKALNSIQEFFTSRNREMPLSNKKQAMLPQGSQVLDNPVGTAPGFALKIGRCLFFFMPGVPFEMRRMFLNQVIPCIKKLHGSQNTFYMVKTISSFGLPESSTGELLADLSSEFPEIQLGLRAKFPEIQVKLYAHSQNKDYLDKQIKKACTWVSNKLGNKIFSFSEQKMEAVVGDLLKIKGVTIAVAESCTGGLISNRLTDVPGSSDYFLFSGITYSNKAKIKVLGVLPETLEKYGAVSKETAKEMAVGVQRVAGADYGLSTSGIAGPDGGTPNKPVGTVCIGLATPKEVKAFQFTLKFATRSMNKNMFAMKSLDLLRRELSGF